MIGAQYLTNNLFSLLWIIDLVETLIIAIGLNDGACRQIWIRHLRINKFFNRYPWQLFSHSLIFFALFFDGPILFLILLDNELIWEVALIESLW